MEKVQILKIEIWISRSRRSIRIAEALLLKKCAEPLDLRGFVLFAKIVQTKNMNIGKNTVFCGIFLYTLFGVTAGVMGRRWKILHSSWLK